MLATELRNCLLAGWLAFVLASCGNVSTHESVFQPIPPDVELGDTVVERQIGPSGGTVQAGPVQLEVPVGTMEDEATIVVGETGEHPPGNVGPVYQINASGSTLGQPVVLTIHLAAEDVPIPYDYKDLRLAYVEDGHWKVLAGSQADEATHTVSGATDHFSVWGVLPKVKIDMLWVVDNSASMCQEQWELSRNFDMFVEKLQTDLTNLDVRLAVTTTDAIVMAGKFANKPATNFPPACYESVVQPCMTNDDCVTNLGNGWECVGYDASKMYNLNGSVNSYCVFRCADDAACCKELCFEDECGADMSCLDDMCIDQPGPECTFECRQPGQGMDSSGCLRPPDTADCPESLPKFLPPDSMELFRCLAIVEPEQTSEANFEQGLKAAWMALDPEGANAAQVQEFIRPDAYLLVVFVTDEDDCSVDENFCSPNYTCDTDDDCPAGSSCKTDAYFSNLVQEKKKLCCGTVKKDYYNVCSLLGEYKGQSHHSCAYDLTCDDCLADEDCDYGWYCAGSSKCRPIMYGLTNIASYQSPPGTPINSLWPVADFYQRFSSLKANPELVMVAAVVGDGVVHPSDEESLISVGCLEHEHAVSCALYAAAKASATAVCLDNPSEAGCEELYQAKLKCIRECYIMSKGDTSNPTVAKNSYVCQSPNRGKADFSARLFNLVDMFSDHGLVVNICSEEGMDEAKDKIADMIINAILF